MLNLRVCYVLYVIQRQLFVGYSIGIGIFFVLNDDNLAVDWLTEGRLNLVWLLECLFRLDLA